jgi:hypothetical protein
MASAEHIFAAIHEVTLSEIPVGRLLVRLRGIHADSTRPLFDEMLKSGFALAAEQPNEELVLAAIAQPWKLRGGRRPPGADFRTFADPGYAMAMNIRLDNGTLSTETRVLLTDSRSRRAFRRYWLVIRPFSGLIRRIWLRAIGRRAETGDQSAR